MQPFAPHPSHFGSRNSLPAPWGTTRGGERAAVCAELGIADQKSRQSRLFLLTRIFFILNPTRRGKKKSVFSLSVYIPNSFCFLWNSSCFPLKLMNSGVGA